VNLLAMDTAFGACSAAIVSGGVSGGELVASLYEERQRGHAERLVPMITEVCEEARLALGEMDYIAVTRGPGTFAGVRIGLAVAKGLGLALGRPLIAVGTLESIAMNVLEYDEIPEGGFAVAHDARRGEIYLQQFCRTGSRIHPLTEPQAVPLDDVPNRLDPQVGFLFGTGAGLVKERLMQAGRADMLFPDIQTQPDAAILARLAWERRDTAQEENLVQPLYLRPPDAVLPQPVILPFQD